MHRSQPATQEILAAIASSSRRVPDLRRIRQSWTRALANAGAGEVLAVAYGLVAEGSDEARFIAYELIHFHRAAANALGPNEVRELGRGLASWVAVDAFAYSISGPAWKRGNLSDEVVMSWTGSPDRWWRRAALASTVILNRKPPAQQSVARTLSVCAALTGDRDDMVVKALSWALREASKVDRAAVAAFVEENGALASRVKREVATKLRTGLKTAPRRKAADRD